MFFIFLHHICLAYAKVFFVLEPIKEEVGRRRAKKKLNLFIPMESLHILSFKNFNLVYQDFSFGIDQHKVAYNCEDNNWTWCSICIWPSRVNPWVFFFLFCSSIFFFDRFSVHMEDRHPHTMMLPLPWLVAASETFTEQLYLDWD